MKRMQLKLFQVNFNKYKNIKKYFTNLILMLQFTHLSCKKGKILNFRFHSERNNAGEDAGSNDIKKTFKNFYFFGNCALNVKFAPQLNCGVEQW